MHFLFDDLLCGLRGSRGVLRRRVVASAEAVASDTIFTDIGLIVSSIPPDYGGQHSLWRYVSSDNLRWLSSLGPLLGRGKLGSDLRVT